MFDLVFQGRIDDCEHGIADRGPWNRLTGLQAYVATMIPDTERDQHFLKREERNAAPVNKFSQILLLEHKRMVRQPHLFKLFGPDIRTTIERGAVFLEPR